MLYASQGHGGHEAGARVRTWEHFSIANQLPDMCFGRGGHSLINVDQDEGNVLVYVRPVFNIDNVIWASAQDENYTKERKRSTNSKNTEAHDKQNIYSTHD